CLRPLHAPWPLPHQSMHRCCGIAGMLGEPWKDDRHTATDRMALGISASVAREDHRVMPTRLPVHKVRPVQIEHRFTRFGFDMDARQIPLATLEKQHARQREPLIELLDDHGASVFAFASGSYSRAVMM